MMDLAARPGTDDEPRSDRDTQCTCTQLDHRHSADKFVSWIAIQSSVNTESLAVEGYCGHVTHDGEL